MLREAEIFGAVGAGSLLVLRAQNAFLKEEKARLFFNELRRNDRHSHGWRRVNRLVDLRFLRREEHAGRPAVYLLTWRGHGKLKDRNLNKRTRPREVISQGLVRHELAVAAVGLTLKKLWGLDVRVSRPARRASLRQPNADLVAFTPQGKRALEIEMSRKTNAKYCVRWPKEFELYQCPILYITDFGGDLDCIYDNATKIAADYIYACRMSEFRRSFGKAPFKNYLKQEIVLAENAPQAAAKTMGAIA